MPDIISEKELLSLIKQLDAFPAIEAEAVTAQPESPLTREDHSGKAEVKGGHIIVTDPAGGGAPATLCAIHPARLIVNGSRIKEDKRHVTASDRIGWEVEEAPLYQIEVSPDNMKSYFRIRALHRYGWKLCDKTPSGELLIEAVQDEERIIESVSLTRVMTEIRKMNIVKNLKTSAIYQEIQEPTYETILIAEGIEPKPSRDAKLELYFNEHVESSFHEVRGQIDFRNHLKIPSVNVGDVIARKIPPAEGTAGYDIYGSIVKPPPPKDVMIVAKDHVIINEELQVIAQKVGRPRITGGKIKYFDIATSYIVPGDVDLKSGNIVFSGDVIVYGNVQDGMIIESLGNVYVSGSVYRAKITATGSITVNGNIIASQLYSGYFGVIFNRLYISAKKLSQLLRDFTDASRMLTQLVESKGKPVHLGQIFLLLLENKFKEIPGTVTEILGCIHSIQNINEKELEELKTNINLFLHPLRVNQLSGYQHFEQVQLMVSELFHRIERAQETLVQIDIAQCHLSELKSNGDILIRKEGVLQSQLYAKDNIVFYSKDAVCRGSKLEAGYSISAMNVGGETGGETVLKAKEKITLRKMNIGRLIVGRFAYDVEEPLENVKVTAGSNGLMFEKDHFS